MEAETTVLTEAAAVYVDRWNRLISTTNWEKGRIIAQWRESLEQAGAPIDEYSDEAWSRQVGGVTPQHVGRLRRAFLRFGETFENYPGLFWSHFQAALDWDDAEMYLEGAVQNGWSVSQMRNQRWEVDGAQPDREPRAEDIVSSEIDEDFAPSDDSPPPVISDTLGEVHDTDDACSWDEPCETEPSNVVESDEPEPQTVPLLRPFESLPPLPSDLNEGFELMKLAILNHKVSGWSDIARDDVLSAIESLRQLVLAPS